jgi:hypothetical protein
MIHTGVGKPRALCEETRRLNDVSRTKPGQDAKLSSGLTRLSQIARVTLRDLASSADSRMKNW